uniref:Inactive rhomboid protein 1 n=1 Tax=Monodon monoceros TaxID=40151 RepID=A0A8C6AFB1_MONMO
MGEARRDSTSSLQRKKPPWLKLDIPAVVPPAAEESSFLQPLRRQAFLRSVSMPAEPTRVPSPHQEPRRPGLQRQMSITQTIRRPWSVRRLGAGMLPRCSASEAPAGERGQLASPC